MKYEIVGSTMPAVEVTMEAGEAMFTQSGGMAWMTEGITMDTNLRGGLMKGIGRMFAGESLFMATYTAERSGVTIAFASTVPGEIVPIDLSQRNGIICQKGAFLCAQPNVNVAVTFTKKLSAGLFGGEGFILQEMSGQGIVFLEIDGDLIEKELAPGEVIKVDTGNVVAFDKSVNYEIETVKGIKNIFLGGEGLFLTKLTGPGKVLLQTQNFNEFAGRILKLMPSK
ncbi:TIGR00266 family protein [Candidatus Galacturonibacter soehngenii]|uniref:TIGR00266 family protein n=1 Tax=Candidatus Galacturonatibacter soehngenii TaxID=2307010 RepID=A0A7V7UDG2_9FIRM|nr:TIGR00266 family protein [Candidatus Galacturonibacter soehngenii]KAB1440547.1 TIGR00266 family protein [Candidatus Galacturonibacter soehngenii]